MSLFYIAAETKLAEQLGYTDIIVGEDERLDTILFAKHQNFGDIPRSLPKWTRDWAAIGPLMVKYGCWPSIDDDGNVWVNSSKFTDSFFTSVSKHLNNDMAVRYALTMAIASYLKRGGE